MASVRSERAANEEVDPGEDGVAKFDNGDEAVWIPATGSDGQELGVCGCWRGHTPSRGLRNWAE